jgi:hypothetical protein
VDVCTGFDVRGVLLHGRSDLLLGARERSLDRDVLLRVTRPSAEAAAREAARQQAALSWHGAVLTVLGEGRAKNGWWYSVLEDPSGGPLVSRVTARSAARGARSSTLVVGELVESLRLLHAVGIHHGGVRPEHVWTAADGSIRLDGFGTTHEAIDDPACHHTGEGVPDEPPAATPEQADAFGVGVVAWFVSSGGSRLPMAGPGRLDTAGGRTPNSSDLGVVPGLGDILTRCLSPQPRHRPTMPELAEELSSTGRREAGSTSGRRRSGRGASSATIRPVLERSVAGRRAVMERLIRDLEHDLEPVELIRRILHMMLATPRAT